MPAREPFAYAVMRIVPDLDRGETLNAGVVLFCRGRQFLELRSRLPETRLTSLCADVDVDGVRRHLEALELVARGDAAGGPIAADPPSARFHWLVAPTSTIVQASEVHTGLCDDPGQTLERLFRQLVL